jgi:DNA-binding response OmpR family regulator
MSQGKVFIIDDDENALNMARRVLEKADYEVATTTRVIGTTSAINSFEPDIILLDVMMPALSGERMVELLQKGLRKKPRIILFSNKSEDELVKLTRESGADDHIAKISGPSSILRKVSEQMKKIRQET